MKNTMKLLVGTLMVVFAVMGFGLAASAADTQDQVGKLLADFNTNDSHFELGLDMMTIGKITRDNALGYPKSAIGGNLGLGIVYRKYITNVDQGIVKATVEEIMKQNPSISDQSLRLQVKNTINKKLFAYWGLNTTALVIPGGEFGATLNLGAPDGTGVDVNFGVISNLAWFLIPVPYIGLTYSF